MSLWSRLANVFRGDGPCRDIDEEMQSHIEEAIERGRDPEEARRAFGYRLRHRESSLDIRLVAWLESLRADAIFGWRQLNKNKVTSAAAILSLGLAIGACTSAFRLIDALLLRPLPVSNPQRLYALFRQGTDSEGHPRLGQSYDYPVFRQLRARVKDEAELIAVSYTGTGRMDLTYASNREMEKAYVQYVSGWMFGSFGLQPALGRLLTENDDLAPGSHPYAVLSYHYWQNRFGGDTKVIGRTFRMANDGMWKTSDQPSLFEIVGIAPERFTGTEPGTVIDIFLPTMMHAGVNHPDWNWFRTLVLLKPGVAVEPVREKLTATFQAFHAQQAKEFSGQPKQWRDRYLSESLMLEPAPSGISDLQKEYRVSLAALGMLVALVLLIACANVANLMTAQAAARARELALRVSIGAGRWRLVQLVLMESAWLAFLAAALGGIVAWWSAPLVVRMINPPDNPARLMLPADGRVFGFGLALTLGAAMLFGLAPALRCFAVQPAGALKGGDFPHSRRRLMHVLIAVQVAFCFLVLFVAGMFVVTFNRLSNQPTGFSADRVLTLETVVENPQPPAVWDQVADHLREVPGVENVALAGWALMRGMGWDSSISVYGAPPSQDRAAFLNVSPGWTEAMKIPFIDGRDFTAKDAYPGVATVGVAIVNDAFAKRYFHGGNPIGKSFEKVDGGGRRLRFQIVGLVRNARYGGMRGPFPPTVYVPFRAINAEGALQSKDSGTFILRASGPNPLALASILSREVSRARAEFRVSNIRTQTELVQQHTVRERLLAMLALFFAMLALLLAGVGLFGVLNYSVVQRRREIGIRMALGARAVHVARGVAMDVLGMVVAGAAAGLALGMASVRYIASLLYQVKATDLGVLALPSFAILAAALLAALPAVIRAVRIDPAATLRTE